MRQMIGIMLFFNNYTKTMNKGKWLCAIYALTILQNCVHCISYLVTKFICNNMKNEHKLAFSNYLRSLDQ